MSKVLPFCIWSLVTLGVVALAIIAGYATLNNSGHTGWEPFTLFILFAPLAVLGATLLVLRKRFAGVVRPSAVALAVGLAGMVLVFYLDRTNRLGQYDRWIQRGMP